MDHNRAGHLNILRERFGLKHQDIGPSLERQIRCLRRWKSRIAPLVVCDGNQYGVVVSPSLIRRCQKMCVRAFARLPVRNASGTNPSDSQK